MIEFKSITQKSTYLNPFDNFKPFTGKIEIRWDPLTQITSRIVHFPPRKSNRFDYRSIVDNSRSVKCPFCPENLDAMTSRFDKTFFGFERLEKDGVTVIPNVLTFDKYCLVAILCQEHFVDMGALVRNGYVQRGIAVLLEALRVIHQRDRTARFFSINCNYMPMSGSSIIHPHIQAIVGEYPTNYHGMSLRASDEFFRHNGVIFWDELMTEEARRRDRFIGFSGSTRWYAPFAPRGNVDIGSVFEKNSVLDFDEGDLRDFGSGLEKVLRYLDGENVPGFNLSLFSGIPEENYYRANMRLVARRFLPPMNAADSNYFDKLHMESACLFLPEDVSHSIRKMWDANT